MYWDMTPVTTANKRQRGESVESSPSPTDRSPGTRRSIVEARGLLWRAGPRTAVQ